MITAIAQERLNHTVGCEFTRKTYEGTTEASNETVRSKGD